MGSLSPVLAKTVPRRSPYQHWKIYQEEVLPLSKIAFKQNPPFPFAPSSRYLRNLLKKQLILKILFVPQWISQRKHLMVSHYFSISLQQGVTALSTQKFAFLTQEGKGACTHVDYVLASSCSSYFYPSGPPHPGQVFSHHSHILSANPPQSHRDITSVNQGTPAHRANHQLLTMCVSSQTAQPGSLALPADRMSCPGQGQEQRNIPSASAPPVSRILPPLHRVLFSAFSSFSVSPPQSQLVTQLFVFKTHVFPCSSTL